MTRVTEPSAWKSEFVYDGKMKMRISKDYEWRNSVWVQTNEVRRVYDGMLVIQERDQLNIAKLTYTRGKDLSGSLKDAGGIGGLLGLSDRRSQILDHNYYHADGNGNVTALVDTNQYVVARYVHDPFGNAVSGTGWRAEGNRHRFSSKERHANSSMVYYGYRWYVPGSQRWLNRDPIAEEGGPNLFGFCHNRPTSGYDAFGLDSVTRGERIVDGKLCNLTCVCPDSIGLMVGPDENNVIKIYPLTFTGVGWLENGCDCTYRANVNGVETLQRLRGGFMKICCERQPNLPPPPPPPPPPIPV